jgi:hypothetical protein
MEFQFEGEDGSKFLLQTGDKLLFGRGSGFNTDDQTVSRRHVSFQLNESDSESPRVSFQVIGRNPIWVLKNNDRGALKLFRKFDKGQLELGDRFCLSGKTPIWFNFNKNQDFECEIDFDQLDVSQFDPVKGIFFFIQPMFVSLLCMIMMFLCSKKINNWKKQAFFFFNLKNKCLS